jgi:hypothetical protein
MLPWSEKRRRVDVKVAGPRYDPRVVGRLALQDRVISTMRVAAWLINHGYDASEQLVEVLVSLDRSGRWLGSCVLANAKVADEYVVVVEGVEWYLKFYVDEDQVAVNVWSCCWEGVIH